jgi:hypothetical protein
MCYNKHYIFYIVMDETTNFTSHVPWPPTIGEAIFYGKPYSLGVLVLLLKKVVKLVSFLSTIH